MPARRWGALEATTVGALTGGLVTAIALSACSPEHRTSSRTAADKNHRSALAAAPAKVDCHVRKCIALTFDDGPAPSTSQLLDILKADHVRATFFILGQQIANNADLLKREATDGHELGNHTFTHVKLAGASAEKVKTEILRTQVSIEQVTGKTPVVFRPTYGATDKQLDTIAKQNNLAEILWTIDTLDWRDHDPAVVTKRVLTAAKPGHIVLLHDVKPSTVAAVPGIVKGLAKQGYTFVTISELYGGKLTPGDKYPPFLGSPTAGPAPVAPPLR